MRVGRRGERIAVAHIHADGAIAQRAEHVAGHLLQVLGGVVEQHRLGQRSRFSSRGSWVPARRWPAHSSPSARAGRAPRSSPAPLPCPGRRRSRRPCASCATRSGSPASRSPRGSRSPAPARPSLRSRPCRSPARRAASPTGTAAARRRRRPRAPAPRRPASRDACGAGDIPPSCPSASRAAACSSETKSGSSTSSDAGIARIVTYAPGAPLA